MYQKKMDFMKCVDSLSTDVVLNKGQGTVTIPFRSFFLLRHDSTMLHLLINNIGETSDILLQEYKRDEFLGSAFCSTHLPMTDIESMSYVYGVPVETIEKFMKMEELNGK